MIYHQEYNLRGILYCKVKNNVEPIYWTPKTNITNIMLYIPTIVK